MRTPEDSSPAAFSFRSSFQTSVAAVPFAAVPFVVFETSLFLYQPSDPFFGYLTFLQVCLPAIPWRHPEQLPERRGNRF